MTRYRYSRWDGTQDPLADLEAADRLADLFSDAVLDGHGAEQAMRRLLDRGMPGRFGGLDQMRERLREMRRRHEQSGDLGDALADLRDAVEEVVADERATLADDPSSDARFREMVLDQLPDSTAGRIGELQRYEFASDTAAAGFERILERLRKQFLDAQLGQMTQAMESLSEQDLAELKHMLADLNELLERRRAGDEPSQADFDEFMGKHGCFFPDSPRTLDELLVGMAQRAAAMSRFMASLSPEQRAQLQQLSQQLLGDLDLDFQLDRLTGNLRATMPNLAWDQPAAMEGDQPLGMPQALAQIEALSEIEALEQAMSQRYAGAAIEDVDPERVRRLLGEDAARDLEALRRIERMLEEAGMIHRTGGRLELTARGIRRLGERALATVFERLRLDRPGSHELRDAGGSGEPTGSTRPWRFGDPFRIALGPTVHNAVVAGRAAEGRVRLAPDDFELAEAEHRTATATVLLLDMSRSMPLRGHWEHARRMVFALHALISGQYPEDRLHVVGFSDYARRLQPADLAAVDWEPVYGTNMEHAFRLAGRILAKESAPTRQVMMVTDGEPTAHLVGDQVYFNWPPVRETIDRTLREALRLSRAGVTINVFMLEEAPGLVAFMDRMAQLVQGRVFAVPDADLGAIVLRDYVRGRGR